MIYAANAGTPGGVLWRINHDNNHHLYSLWLQAIGSGVSPLLARLPAILAGRFPFLLPPSSSGVARAAPA